MHQNTNRRLQHRILDECNYLSSPQYQSNHVSKTMAVTKASSIKMSVRNILELLQWCHNRCDSVSNHQPHHCLLNRWFRRRSKKTSKLRVTGLCAGNSPGTGEFPAQMASNAENVSIRWRHHFVLVSVKPMPQTSLNMNHRTSKLYRKQCLCTSFRRLRHDDVIKWKHFPRYRPFVRETIGHLWIPLTKGSDAELWCFLWSAPEQTVD